MSCTHGGHLPPAGTGAGCAEHGAPRGASSTGTANTGEPRQGSHGRLWFFTSRGAGALQGSCAARAVYDEVDFTAALLRGARCQPGREFPSSLERDDRQQLHGLTGPCASGASSPLRALRGSMCQGEDSAGSPATREHNRLCSVSATGGDFRKSGFVVEDKLELR